MGGSGRLVGLRSDAAGDDQGPLSRRFTRRRRLCALWDGDNAALKWLVEGAASIDGLSPDSVDRKAYAVRKRAGGTLVWIAQVAAGGSAPGDVEPPQRSAATSRPWRTPPVPSTPSDALWIHLAAFEFTFANLGDTLFRAHQDRLKKTPYALLRMSFGLVEFATGSAILRWLTFPRLQLNGWRRLRLCRIYYKDDGLGAADPLGNAGSFDPGELGVDLILVVLVNAVFALTARSSVPATVIAAWRDSAAKAEACYRSSLTGWISSRRFS